MRVDDRNPIGTGATEAARGAEPAETRGAARSTSAGAGGIDQAEVSGLAGKLAEAVSGQSSERLERLEQLRLEIADGRYRPDPAKIARALVDDAVAGSKETPGE